MDSGRTTAEAVGECMSIKKMDISMQDTGKKTRRMGLVRKSLQIIHIKENSRKIKKKGLGLFVKKE